MNLPKHLTIAAAATALLAGTALPASAAVTTTTTTFEITGGLLALTVQPAADLGPDAAGTTAISGTLGLVLVTDARGGTAVWAVSAASTALTGLLGSSSTAVSYSGGAVTKTGSITVADGSEVAIGGGAAQVVVPSALSGINTASWNPTLTVTMPASALADHYSGTVTTSVL
jgi:hypothetical protein